MLLQKRDHYIKKYQRQQKTALTKQKFLILIHNRNKEKKISISTLILSSSEFSMSLAIRTCQIHCAFDEQANPGKIFKSSFNLSRLALLACLTTLTINLCLTDYSINSQGQVCAGEGQAAAQRKWTFLS